MKTHVKRFLTLLGLMFVLCMSATVANSQSSTPTSPAALDNAAKETHQEASEVNRETQSLLLELRIRRMLAEVKAGRALVTKQREELAAADAQLETEKQNSASLEKSNQLAVSEIKILRSAIDHQIEALNAKTEAVLVLKERNEELKSQVSKNRKRAFWATAAAAILGGVLIIK